VSGTKWPDHLLPLDDWDALPEDNSRRVELAEGVLETNPRPVAALIEFEVVLSAGPRPTVRVPDVVVVDSDGIDQCTPRVTASQVRAVVEVVSPGSRRRDRVAKLADYAAAGIPQYWIVDIESPVTLDVYSLVGDVCELTVHAATGVVELGPPDGLRIDLPALDPRH
jgi:Uma2 family endonuclease